MKTRYCESPALGMGAPKCSEDCCDIGGFHDSGMGWNPNGNWCGECSTSNCRECPNV